MGCLPITFTYKKLERIEISTVTNNWKTERQYVLVVSITGVDDACQSVELVEVVLRFGLVEVNVGPVGFDKQCQLLGGSFLLP